MLSPVLSILALFSAVLTIRAYWLDSDAQKYIFKPLTMIFIIALAFNGDSSPNFYKTSIIIGLIFSLAGDVFLISPRFFLHGLIAFLLAHICYIAAFFHVPGLLAAVPFLIYVLFFLRVLWSNLRKLKPAVFVYALVIAAMGWFAVDRAIPFAANKDSLAALGALLFIVSDSILACNKFKAPFKSADFLILSTYFAAQWLIALSV